MPEFKVVMTARVLSRRDIELYQTNLDVDFQTIPCNTEDEITAAARDADAVVTLMQPYTRRVIQSLEKCKLIFNAGTGFDTIDVQAATDNGIFVANPGEYCTEEVAEHAISLLLACARKITRLDRAVREGKWTSFEKREIRGQILPPLFQWQGQTLGLIGLGRIGRAIVPMAKGVGLDVIVFDHGRPRAVFAGVGVAPVTLE
jgi:D-3-phosphoglycerate dehydrogenase